MIKSSEIFFLIILQIFSFFTPAIAKNETLRYIICKNNVAQVNIVNYAEKYSVTIKLSQSATKDFKDITARNIGRRLTIMINDNSVVTSAIIKAEIDSGIIQSSQMTESEAKIMQQRIINASERPCGLVR